MNRGQIFSTDFMFALSLFLIGVTMTLVTWRNYEFMLQQQKTQNEILRSAFLVSDIWWSEGLPNRWNPSNVVSIGLMNDNVINTTKLQFLQSLGYERVKQLLNAQLYEIYFRVSDRENKTLFEFGQPPVQPDFVSKVGRIGILNHSIVLIETMVWK